MITRESNGENLVSKLGRAVQMTLGALSLFPLMFLRSRSRRETVQQMYVAGIRTLPLMTIVSLFTGMILALQVGLELSRYSQEVFIGSAVMVSLLREMGPFMTGIVMASCVGSAMAAQLGTMTVNDEIAALEMMTISPIRFLMAPRMAAMVVMLPLLSFYACAVGVLGGGIVGATQLALPWDQYIGNAMLFARERDLWVGLLKALIFGILITGISCYQGFVTTQGAVGVGRTTRKSVIYSLLAILISGYMVTRLFYE